MSAHTLRMGIAVTLVLAQGCRADGGDQDAADPYGAVRGRLLQRLVAQGIADTTVLAALDRVPRHLYVPPDLRRLAYENRPLPIGEGQTISQPYIVAFMTEALELGDADRVLEIGTGSGYQAAVLAELVEEVYSIEIIPSLARTARERLASLGYDNVWVRAGDGYFGWPEKAPFDAIIVTASPDHVPQALVDQLAMGAHLVLPVGEHYQELVRITRSEEGLETERLLPVAFVPMTGKAQE
ncbi:protein-L-isoaspartate(D-aspartate) O-methyltransferase [Candidatus Latescibacterota bacterium]